MDTRRPARVLLLLLPDPDHANDRSGCTAVALLVTPDNRLFCANAGDSRCVLSRGGLAIPLSFDHKPDNSGVHAADAIQCAGEHWLCSRADRR